jgi:hypothetical protein
MPRPQTAVGESPRKDAVSQVPQLRSAVLVVLERLADERRCLFVVRLERLLSECERDDGVHQPLLRAVVQVE